MSVSCIVSFVDCKSIRPEAVTSVESHEILLVVSLPNYAEQIVGKINLRLETETAGRHGGLCTLM